MNNSKSYEFNFFYLINKCILLFKYININHQKTILNEIKLFINKLQQIFSGTDFNSSIDKKNKILEVLIYYFKNIIDNNIYNLIEHKNKDLIIIEIEKIALIACQNNDKKTNATLFADKILEESININKDNNANNSKYDLKYESKNDLKYESKNDLKYESKNDLKYESKNNFNMDIKIEELEKKFNNKIKIVFNEIENNIKNSLKNYLDYTQQVEYNLDKKINTIVNDKVSDIINDTINSSLNNTINDTINNTINDKIYNTINYNINDTIIDTINNTINNRINNNNYLDIDLKNKIESEIDEKIKILASIFNENIQKIFNNLNMKIMDNEEELIKIFEEKINKSNFNKNNFNIIYDKENNEIKLYYCNDIITSTKINIKGLIGPKGPVGNKGDKGETPIIRKIQFTEDKKIKFIIQESNNIYEVLSDDNIPSGPAGPQGERGEQGKAIIELKWDQDNVMKIDDDNKDSLIFLKSLCIGEKSHCLKDNSLSIGGGICYQNNSFALGLNSKTLDSESIALYGSCIGKKALAYRANNIDENTVQFGLKDKNNYNINSFNILSKEINFECGTFKIKTNKYENSKFLELEERVILLEKKIIDILKKI